MAIETYNLITNGCSLNTIIDKGCRNGLSVLKRFKIIEVSKNTITMLDGAMGNYKSIDDLIWSMTKKEESIQKCITKIKKRPNHFKYIIR